MPLSVGVGLNRGIDKVWDWAIASHGLVVVIPQEGAGRDPLSVMHGDGERHDYVVAASRCSVPFAMPGRKRFSPRNKRIGEAMKIEDDVPTTMPKMMATAKP